MAKQSGIHQIKGKVGEMSYYRQSGVSGGLIRSINQGMSARVKTGDEYINARRNNAEFALACRVAGALGGSVIPKWRPMFLTFSQSAIAKKVLELIKLDTSEGTTWGTRGLLQTSFEDALAALNGRAKNPFADFVANVTLKAGSTSLPQSEAVSVVVTLSPNYAEKLAAIGCVAANIYVNIFQVNVGNYNAGVSAYGNTSVRQRGAESTFLLPSASEQTINVEYLRLINPLSAPSFTQRVVGIVIVPYRTVNGENFEMQEYATFQDYAYTPA